MALYSLTCDNRTLLMAPGHVAARSGGNGTRAWICLLAVLVHAALLNESSGCFYHFLSTFADVFSTSKYAAWGTNSCLDQFFRFVMMSSHSLIGLVQSFFTKSDVEAEDPMMAMSFTLHFEFVVDLFAICNCSGVMKAFSAKDGKHGWSTHDAWRRAWSCQGLQDRAGPDLLSAVQVNFLRYWQRFDLQASLDCEDNLEMILHEFVLENVETELLRKWKNQS